MSDGASRAKELNFGSGSEVMVAGYATGCRGRVAPLSAFSIPQKVPSPCAPCLFKDAAVVRVAGPWQAHDLIAWLVITTHRSDACCVNPNSFRVKAGCWASPAAMLFAACTAHQILFQGGANQLCGQHSPPIMCTQRRDGLDDNTTSLLTRYSHLHKQAFRYAQWCFCR